MTTDALLLRATDYRDADRITTLFTREHGKISAVARHARRSRKRFGGALEPLHLLRVEVALGRRDLATLSTSSVLATYPGVLASLAKIRAGGQIMALLRGVLPDRQPDERLFDEAIRFLEVLSESSPAPSAIETLRVAFSARVLALVGLTPELDVCAVSGRHCPPGHAALFDPSRGGVVSRTHGGGRFLLSGSTRAHVRRAFSSAWVEELQWNQRTLEQARAAIEAFIDTQLNP